MLLRNVTAPSGPASDLGSRLGPGSVFLWFDTLFRTAPLNATLEILPDYIALPAGGVVDTGGSVRGLTLLHRNGSMCRITCRYVVDGSPEGYGAAAFGLPVVFGREALRNGSTWVAATRNEPYAGRRVYSRGGHGPPVIEWSDPTAETEDVSSTAGSITNACQYMSDGVSVPPDAPWLLSGPPAGYKDGDFRMAEPFHDGSCCQQCHPTVMRYQGLRLSVPWSADTGSTGPALPLW